MFAAQIVIGVFGLFHPTELWIQPAASEPILAANCRLEGSQTAKFRLGRTGIVHVTSVSGGPSDFLLIVPGQFQRQFRGVLTIKPRVDRFD